MNTSNFPQNKLRKRKEALERLKKQLSSNIRYRWTSEDIKAHIAHLEAKLKGSVG